MQMLSNDAKHQIDEYLRGRVRFYLAVCGPVLGILVGLLGWAAHVTGQSLAQAAVNAKLGTHDQRIEAVQDRLDDVHEKLGATTQLADKLVELDITALAKLDRVEEKIRQIDTKLALAKNLSNLIKAVDQVSTDSDFQDAVRDGLIDEFFYDLSERHLICRSLTVQSGSSPRVKLETDTSTGGVLRLADERGRERTLFLSPDGVPTFSSPFACRSLTVTNAAGSRMAKLHSDVQGGRISVFDNDDNDKAGFLIDDSQNGWSYRTDTQSGP